MKTIKDYGITITGEFVAIHDGGVAPCNGVTFFYKGTVGPDHHIEAKNAYSRNGTQPLSNYSSVATPATSSLASPTSGSSHHSSPFI